jgi:hypothetical protein
MASESAGIVYAEVRLKLDQIQGDISKVTTLFNSIATQTSKTTTATESRFALASKNIDKTLTNMSKSSVNQFTKMATGMQSAIMALPIIGFISMVAGAVQGIFSKVADWAKTSLDAYRDYEEKIKVMGAVVQSTGAAAWTTQRQLEGMAKTLSSETGRSVSSIMEMQTVLLGFRTVSGDVFERTSKAILDLSAVMGGNLTSAANTVGKAIDTPVQGMTALSRQGFIFTQEEKNMVAALESAGEHMQAQTIILKALEGAFKGASDAVKDANLAHSELEASEERLRIAQGKSLSGFAMVWDKIWTYINNTRAARKELENEAAAALSLDSNYYSGLIEQINNAVAAGRLTEKMAASLIQDLDVQSMIGQVAVIKQQIEDLRKLETSPATIRIYEPQIERLQVVLGQTEAIVAQRQAELEILQKIALEESEHNTKVEAELLLLHEIATVTDYTVRSNSKYANSMDTIEEKINIINKKAELGLIGGAEINEQRALAYNSYVDSLVNSLVILQSINTTTDEGLQEQVALRGEINNRLQRAIATAKEYNDLVDQQNAKPPPDPAKTARDLFQDEYIAIMQRYQMLEKTHQSFQANFFETEEQTHAAILAARKAQVDALNSLFERYGEGIEGNAGYIQNLQMAMEAYNEELQWAEDHKIEKVQDKDDSYDEDLIRWYRDQDIELRLLSDNIEIVQQAEHERALNNLRDSELYKKSSEEVKKSMEAMFEAVYTQANAVTVNIESFWDKLSGAVKKYGYIATQALSSILQIVQNVAKQRLAIEQDRIDKEAELNREAREKEYEEQEKELERQYQLKLFYAGLGEAVGEEEFELRVQRAIESGDQLVELEARRALEKYQIDEQYRIDKENLDTQYDLLETQANEAMNKAKAESQYKYDLSVWRGQLLTAAANVAQSILTSYAQSGPFGIPMAAIMGGLGALQIAAITAAKPKMQYAEGGIVPGSSFSGDRITAGVNSGEMILTRGDQQSLLDMIQSGFAGMNVPNEQTLIEIPISLDGNIITKVVVENINNRKYRISQRSLDR